MESLKGIVTMHQRWKVLSTVPLRLSTMPLRVQDTNSRFQHSVWNSWPIEWNVVIYIPLPVIQVAFPIFDAA